MAAIRRIVTQRAPRGYGAVRTYKPSFRATAKRILTRTFRATSCPQRVLTRYSTYSFKVRRNRRFDRKVARHFRARPRVQPRKGVSRSTLHLEARPTFRKQYIPGLRYKHLHPLFAKRDRRKAHKRGHRRKAPGLRRQNKHVVVARQILRKLRALSRSATRALRRRVLRHKRRHYRRLREKFSTIRYTRRVRVKRRMARRVRRYVHSTFTVLRGARARTLHRRAISRLRRTVYLRTRQSGRKLLLNSTHSAQAAGRRQLFILKELRRRLRAVRFVANRTQRSVLFATRQNLLSRRRATTRLKRRLTLQTAGLSHKLPQLCTSIPFAAPAISFA